MSRFFILFFSFFTFSCVTSVKRTLPDLSKTEISTTKIIKISFDENLLDYEQDIILKAIAQAGFSKNIKLDIQTPRHFKKNEDIKTFDDFFPQIDNQTSVRPDLQISIMWKKYGFFEPYCIFFLAVIPCTPPYQWTLGARASDSNKTKLKDYIVNESAFGMFWLPFLNPKFWDQSTSVELELLTNAFKNLMLELKNDRLI